MTRVTWSEKRLRLAPANVPSPIPNPTASAIVRAADAHDRWTLFRNDLVRLARPTVPPVPAVPKNPHTFLTNIGSAATVGFAVAAQQQIATFFVSRGTVTIDPDGAGPFFETPVVLPLPEALNFIP